MLLRGFAYINSLSLFLLFSCAEPKAGGGSTSKQLINDTTIKYAKRFAIARERNVTVVYLFGNRADKDTTATYVLANDTTGLKSSFKGANVVKIPCKRIAALSSIYAAMLCELGAGDFIAAIDNIDYVNNEQIIEKFDKGLLRELAKTPELDLEQTIALQPDIIFSFGMGVGEQKEDVRLKYSNLPMVISLDHLEESPLARAEWIKCFAAFVDKMKTADSIFAQVEQKYLHVKALTDTLSSKPTVLSETKFGDVWYLPGGKSYMACILRDAGANYLWAENEDVGSLPLSFEQVYARAKEADYWINLPLVKSKKELISYESRYGEFKAFKTGMLYNNTKHSNNKGYSIYWETGMIHPERILSDLAQIFHPDLSEELKNEWYYYEQLK